MLVLRRKTIPLFDTDKNLFVRFHLDTATKKESRLAMWLRDSTPSPMPWHGEVDIAEKRFKLLRWTGFQKSNIMYISHIVIHGKEKTVDDESFLQISFALGNFELFFILWWVLIMTIEAVRKPFDFWISLVVGCAFVLLTLFLMVDLNKSENAIDDYIEKIRSQASVKRDV